MVPLETDKGREEVGKGDDREQCVGRCDGGGGRSDAVVVIEAAQGTENEEVMVSDP